MHPSARSKGIGRMLVKEVFIRVDELPDLTVIQLRVA